MPVRNAQGIVTLTAMITTCPACRTAFRITNEQLAARNGSVRCGRCLTVFDAREALQADPVQPALQSGGSHGGAQTETTPLPETEPITPAPSLAADSEGASHQPSADDITQKPVATVPAPCAPTPLAVPEIAAEPVRSRAGWIAGSMLLALILMMQIAFYFRGEIALVFPEIHPVLAELCASLDCSMPLPRRADMISIESSDLQADPANPGLMVLTATLRNRAAFTQSHPSLELTLTDSQDQPLARRVLGAQDYLGPSAHGEAGFTGNSELSIKLYVEASSLKATGYRLYLFFP